MGGDERSDMLLLFHPYTEQRMCRFAVHTLIRDREVINEGEQRPKRFIKGHVRRPCRVGECVVVFRRTSGNLRIAERRA